MINQMMIPWTPITDCLPNIKYRNEDDSIWICYKFDDQKRDTVNATYEYDTKIFWVTDTDGILMDITKYVTHWIQLPKLPTEK